MAVVQYGVTENGFVRKPVKEVIDSLNKRFKGAFGSLFDTSPESPDGNVIGIVADEIAECWSQAEHAYNAYRPGAVSGVGLDNISELTKVKRYVDRRSSTTVVVGGTVGKNIPAGSVVADEAGMEFKTTEDVVIPGGVTVEAVQSGEYYIAPNTVTKIVTKIEGWTSVNNPRVGQTGVIYESDPQLRVRRDKTTAISGSSFIEAMYANLVDLDLHYIRIRDNDTEESIGKQPPHSIYVVVDGGVDNEIAKKIFATKTAGIPTYGDVTVPVADSKGNYHSISFSRPTKKDIYISGKFKRRVGSLSSKDAEASIKEALIEYINKLLPGSPVVWSYLFTPIAMNVAGVEITELFIGFDASPNSITSLQLDIDQRAFTKADIISFKDVTNA